MRIARSDGSFDHLGYCSNIHPGERWHEVRHNLETYIPGIRQTLAADAPFGIGLRLSAAATDDLGADHALAAFEEFLEVHNCYVFTINGFPYGAFHGTRVKEAVYLPDWKDPARLEYSNRLADLFARWLPAEDTGSISTVPGAFKSEVHSENDIRCMTDRLVDHVAHLVSIERNSGKRIVLALEPEPCCFLETIAECVRYFTGNLYAAPAIERLARALATDSASAENHLRTHLTLCLDLCHAAVEYEDPGTCYAALDAAGINVGKLQISAGLRLPSVNAASVAALEPFMDAVYLHQVIERRGTSLTRYSDLPEAIAAIGNSNEPREWRVHFHVPVFYDKLGEFSSTQPFIVDALARHRRTPISRHLEVETYTWDVLPDSLRNEPLDAAIVRELRWVLNQLGYRR